jgi:hypothetical protein
MPADEKEEHLQQASCKEHGLILYSLSDVLPDVFGFIYLDFLNEFRDLLKVYY